MYDRIVKWLGLLVLIFRHRHCGPIYQSLTRRRRGQLVAAAAAATSGGGGLLLGGSGVFLYINQCFVDYSKTMGRKIWNPSKNLGALLLSLYFCHSRI